MILSAIVATMLTAASPPSFVFEERACTAAELRGRARCGTVAVPENHDRSGGRTIALNVVVLPALADDADLPPLFDIDGGPGLPATKNAGFYLQFGEAYRARRDVVMIDQRGTGGSNPLACPELAAPERADEEMLPVAAVDRCRAALETHADLRRYGTREAVADLDAVRRALGHERIDLFALSYGTTVALRYLANHPGRVRAAVLMGVAPPSAMPPRHHAMAGDRALRLLFADCAADPSCNARFPDPGADLERARARLAATPVPTDEWFMERLRSLMYQPTGARRIPWIVNRAATGDLGPFRAATRPGGPSLLADGMFLSVTCAESFGLMDYEQAAAAARRTPFGDYRLRRQRAACAHWPRGAPASDHLAPVRSDAAILLVSGRLDPVTPPEWADEVARNLPNARHLVIPHGGHIFDGLSNVECFDGLVLRFFETADAAALDPSCLARMEPPPFATGDQAPPNARSALRRGSACRSPPSPLP